MLRPSELRPINEVTRDPTVLSILEVLSSAMRQVLGDHLIGIYLDGSLANGDFDSASDIDFIVVTETEVSAEVFAALQEMHAHIAAGDSPWALQLEGSYISQRALRRYDPALATHPNLERGPGEQLKMAFHDVDWLIHRWVLRERGIVLSGPAPRSLVDPITPDQLRHAMRALLNGWFTQLLNDSARLRTAGYQSYLVLSLCRILYTIQHGTIVSKAHAADWAAHELDPRWHALIEQACALRLDAQRGGQPADPQPALAFLRYAIAAGQAPGSASNTNSQQGLL